MCSKSGLTKKIVYRKQMFLNTKLQSREKPIKVAYRPEIDGLRAIAVSAVILYHTHITILGYQPFEGGFIGVDIFFVLSGYLITSIILKELITTGSFSFKHFYERRIRRILPALLFIMLASLPFAWMYLLPDSFIDFSKSILYSLGFNSNFYFHYSGQIYGAENSLLKPFLHTWSLSVEEQYYILFPIVLLITFKYFRKYIIHILILGFVISLGLADWGSRNHPSFNFYFLPTRMWELLAGSILAYFEITLGHRSKHQTLNIILPTIGISLIGHSILFFNDETFHPSFYTLSPIIGVCLVIWFSHKDELITKILSTKLFVGVGLISYSLYLWHYPIFAFVKIESVEMSKINIIIISLITLIFSIISYYFIERPFRNKKFRFVTFIKYIVFIVFLLIFFSLIVIGKQGRLNKNNIVLEKYISSPLFESKCKHAIRVNNFLSDSFFNKRFNNCKKEFGKFILILGDSYSLDLFNSISKISNEDEFIIGLNRDGCVPSKSSKYCHYLNALGFIEKNSEDIKHIFFTQIGTGSNGFLTNIEKKDSSNSNLTKPKINFTQINNTIKYLILIKELKKELIFIGPHLEPNITLNRRSIYNILNNKNIIDNTNYDLLIVDKKLKEISKINNINYVSKIDTIEFDFKKDFIVVSNFTFSDSNHWSEFGEVYFGKKLVFNSIIKDVLFP